MSLTDFWLLGLLELPSLAQYHRRSVLAPHLREPFLHCLYLTS